LAPYDSDEEEMDWDAKSTIKDEDVVEVGRGLANYSHAQINRVKGLNR